MRRIDYIIRQCRRATDNKDENAISDFEVMQYFNDAQRDIQSIVFTNNNEGDIFTKTRFYALSPSQLRVPLPFDIYAQNSVKDVFMVESNTNRIIQNIKRVTSKERQTLFGYALEGKDMLLTTDLQSSASRNLQVRYEYKVPTLSIPLGTVDSIDTVANTVTIATDLLDNEDFYLEDEYFSFVDDTGIITANRLRLINYTQGDLTLEFVGELEQVLDEQGNVEYTGVAVGNKLCLGENSTTHSVLMDNVETYLIAYVNRMLFGRNSDTDLAVQNVFTQAEEEKIAQIYADSVKDSIHPPSTDNYYLGY